ncbi:hypothetical protein KAR48_02070 [bacterium]|nr:hypothetical protein [bacterium]
MHLFRLTFTTAIMFIAMIISPSLTAQTSLNVSGWVDANRDGINDVFVDADGNGKNDIDGASYTLPFPFRDENSDGINDLWKDVDGDGVNDYLGELLKAMSRWTDSDGDGILDRVQGSLRGRALMQHVLDADKDGKNDITGLAYNGRDILGYRYGNVDEETGKIDIDFADTNSDGMNDHFNTPERQKSVNRGRMDRFFDADGDGIADDRGLRRMRSRVGRRGKK